jgi:molybdopterin synthase sulfur carrier subunit
MITVLYFARLKEALGRSAEDIALPPGVSDVAGLQRWLAGRGGAWAQALGDAKNVRAAVNQAMVQGAAPVADGDEVAFFPPVTGG